MREYELAELLMRMAADRGVETEAAAEELASTALPSFVDARVFRGAVVETLEAHLRAQMEERLQSIRRRFDVSPQPAGRAPSRPIAPAAPVAPAAEPTRAPAAMDGLPDVADATMTDLAQLAPTPAPEDTVVANEEELPTDATMVWTTRHG